MPSYHPLDSLSAAEISLASSVFRTELFRSGIRSAKSLYVTLVEPPKHEVIAYLGLSTSPTDLHPKSSGIKPARRVEASLINTLTGEAFVLSAVLTSPTEAKVDSFEKLAKGVQPGISNEELLESEETVRNDPEVIRLCAEVGVSQEQIMCDCWSIGFDDRFKEGIRLQQAFIYARLGEHEHLYAHSLDFCAVVDANAQKVLKIDFAPHRINSPVLSNGGSTVPHSVAGDSLVDSGRPRIPPAMARHDFIPELVAENAAKEGRHWETRKDVKPLHVVQPQGVSFSMDGNVLSWQNFQMHIGFNYREGIVLSAIQFFDIDEQRLRPIMYRTSCAEMVVPYASPEWPHPRKFAFDVGEYGLGGMANSLALGCDCLGAIHYLDSVMSNHAGQPVPLPTCICIHEEDDGLLWKHTDFRKGGRAFSVRSRKLIIQMICTVANYDYAFAFCFKQDGTMSVDIKLTGILNIYTMSKGESCNRFGTQVAPRVQAQHHQHIFCLRMDPMIDGVNNSVVEHEIHSLASPTGSDENWAGNGFSASSRVLQTTDAGTGVADHSCQRSWSFVNEDKIHYSSESPVGFRIMCKDWVPLFAKPDSIVGRRAPFLTKSLWVTPYVEGQLYPAGKFVQQTPFAPEDSLLGWMKGDKNIAKTDIVVWACFGITHTPRPEDWPIMPYEDANFVIKPSSFFKANPSLDVPATTDKRSVAAFVAPSCCAKL